MKWSGPSHSGGWARQTSVAKVTGGARPVERRLWAYTRTASINQRNQKTAGSSQELLGLADSSQPSGGGGGGRGDGGGGQRIGDEGEVLI